MKKSFIYSSIAVLISLSILFFTLAGFNKKENVGNYTPQITNNTEGYYSVIKQGALEKTITVECFVQKKETEKIALPYDSQIFVKPGSRVDSTDDCYSYGGKRYKLNCNANIISVAQNDTNKVLEYQQADSDSITFNSSVEFYNDISENAIIKIFQGKKRIVTRLTSKTLNDGVAVFKAENLNLSIFSDQEAVSVEVVQRLYRNAVYIDKEYLKNRLGADTYILEICNVHTGEKAIFYSRIITVEKFSEQYYLITSDNVFSYESVYLGERPAGIWL